MFNGHEVTLNDKTEREYARNSGSMEQKGDITDAFRPTI